MTLPVALIPKPFVAFGGLRLDVPEDQVPADGAIYERDTDWDGSVGKVRSRDGFQRLGSATASGVASGGYTGLFAHSPVRILACRRAGSESKLCAIDLNAIEQRTTPWSSTPAKSTFAHFGTPAASYTYCRADTATAKVIRFDGTTFTEPTATVGGEKGKEMPRGAFMANWQTASNRLVVANTGSEGGPNKAASSPSHVWFSEPGNAEAYETTAYVQLSPGDGEEITGMVSFGGMVFVFKETKYFVFYGVSSDTEGRPIFNFRELSLGDGCQIRRTGLTTLAETSDQIACVAATGVYFCTTDGVYVTTGQAPTKISNQLKPLEETTDFTGPMAEFLNGATEEFRWPAAGVIALGQRLFVKRHEYLFFYDMMLKAWGCWRQDSVSMCVWAGLSGGGEEGELRSPGSIVNWALGVVAWENPGNAKVIDASFAQAKLRALGERNKSEYLKATEFKFDVPEEATIEGIEVTVTRRTHGPLEALPGGGFAEADNEVRDTEVNLVKAGAIQTTNKAKTALWKTESTPSEEETAVYGGATDLWGTTWTPEQVNAAGFGAAIAVQGQAKGLPEQYVEALVDAIQITVYYSLPESSAGARPRLFLTSGNSIYWTAPGARDDAAQSEPAWQSGFYNLGSEDEKDLTHCKVWGTGDVELSGAIDFMPVAESHSLVLGESEVDQAHVNMSGTATVFSHRFSGPGPWSVQRLVRYLREFGIPGGESD